MEEENPFEEYYKETFKTTPGEKSGSGDVAREKEEFLLSLEEKVAKKEVSGDAGLIKVQIKAFIKGMNTLIGQVFVQEKKAGTRQDLVVTIVIGGLAFTLANVYKLITKKLKVKMTPRQYEITFLGMYHSAVKGLREDKD